MAVNVENMARISTKKCIIAPSELFTHRNGKFIVLTSPQKNSKCGKFIFFEKFNEGEGKRALMVPAENTYFI